MEKTRSGPHRRFEALLENANIAFQSEYQVSFWSLDIYLPDWHLCVEIDGPGHLSRSDRRRDENLLTRFGIPTLRFKAYLVDNETGRAVIWKRFNAFVEEHAHTTLERLQIFNEA